MARGCLLEKDPHTVCGSKKGGERNQVDSTASKTETLKISGRAKREGDDFLIVYISYNARYTKYRGVKKPSFGLFCFNRPSAVRLGLSRGFCSWFLQLTQLLLFFHAVCIYSANGSCILCSQQFCCIYSVCFIFTGISLVLSAVIAVIDVYA